MDTKESTDIKPKESREEKVRRNIIIDDYYSARKKNQILGLVLTFFLGPIGLFYSNWIAALVLLVVYYFVFGSILIGAALTIYFLPWPIFMLISWILISNHNAKALTEAKLLYTSR